MVYSVDIRDVKDNLIKQEIDIATGDGIVNLDPTDVEQIINCRDNKYIVRSVGSRDVRYRNGLEDVLNSYHINTYISRANNVVLSIITPEDETMPIISDSIGMVEEHLPDGARFFISAKEDKSLVNEVRFALLVTEVA